MAPKSTQQVREQVRDARCGTYVESVIEQLRDVLPLQHPMEWELLRLKLHSAWMQGYIQGLDYVREM